MNTQLLDPETDALTLLERVHASDGTLLSEYPLVFGEDAPGWIVALEEEGEVRSACTVLTRELVSREARITCGLIGSVSTDEECRGKGYATRVLLQAEAEIAQRQAVLALLWADDPEFYLKRGYCAVGSELDFRLDRRCIEALPMAQEGARVRPLQALQARDAQAIHDLYERHKLRVARGAEETAQLLGCPRMETLVLERGGKVVAYASCGRGRDLADTIHEWGGAQADVLALVRAHLERRFGVGMSDADGWLFLMAPGTDWQLAEALEAAGAQSARGILALGRIVDHEAAARLLAERLGDPASVKVVHHPSGPHFSVRGPADEGELDENGALALLFGVDEVRPQVQDFLSRFGFDRAALPVDLFAWGLDSI